MTKKNYELAEHDYILGMKYKDIAEKYNVSTDTVKSWRRRYSWERQKTAKKVAPIAPLNKKGCISEKGVQEELSDKEQLFCYYYVKCWNATQAALKSGYSSNKTSAAMRGSILLKRDRVKQEIDRLRSLIRQEIHLDVMDLIQFCIKIVYADIGDYLHFGQKDVPVMNMFGPVVDKETKEPLIKTVNYVELGESEMLDTSIISEVKQGKDGVSIKLADKKWAWEQLIKYFDMLPDKFRRDIETAKLDIERQKITKTSDEKENSEDWTAALDVIATRRKRQ